MPFGFDFCLCLDDSHFTTYGHLSACCFFAQVGKQTGDRMNRICAWCQQEGIAGIPGKGSGEFEEPVSHGICRDHGLRLRQSYQQNSRRHSAPTPHHS